MNQPIHIHPKNTKCFEFRNKPIVLITATEHYGAVINRPFRFERYLDDAAEKAQTLTRLFILFREQQHSHNPYSTCKPESTDYVSPYPRTGPGKAIDGLPRYDLDQWNPEFFDRLHRFLSLASDRGIIVEVVILSNTYNDDIWMLNPLHPQNNINYTEIIRYPEYLSMRHPNIFERQKALVQKIVEETHRYDNIFYEICNEPTGATPWVENAPTLEEVNAWLTALAQVIKETEKSLPYRHLIAGQEAYRHDGYCQGLDESFSRMFFDVVNVHPLPNTHYNNVNYDLGAFMSKQLRLRALRDFCLAAYRERQPLNCDEDNIASRFRDYEGWTIHRKRAWTALMSGAHYDYIDFSIWPNLETGTPESQRYIRTWMKHLSLFIHSMDLTRAKPLPHIVHRTPPDVLECVFAAPPDDYAIYLADERELEDPQAGKPIRGELEMELPQGDYEVAAYSPETGLYSPAIPVSAGNSVLLTVPEFRHDIVLRFRRKK